MQEEILKEIQKIIKDKYGKSVEMNTKLDEIGADSLDLLDLIVDAEEKHGVRIDDSELLDMKSVEDVVSAIASKLQ